MSTSKKSIDLHSSLSVFLDPEILKTISVPKPVRLHFSKWSNNLMCPGKVQIPENDWNGIFWTYPKELKKQIFPLSSLKSGRIMTGNEAMCFIQATVHNFENANEHTSLVLVSNDTLSIVFDDPDYCSHWIKALKVLIKVMNLQFSSEIWNSDMASPISETSYTAEQYGAIFDISEVDQNNDLWQTIKVTFVKEDSSQVDHLNFDRIQQNLNNSAQEVLVSIENNLDGVNLEILKSYLNDVIRSEHIKRFENLEHLKELKKLKTSDFHIKRKDNTKIRKAYGELDGPDIATFLLKTLANYNRNTARENIDDALQLIYIQKILISLDLHSVACEHLMHTIRKSLRVSKTNLLEEDEGCLVKGISDDTYDRRVNEIIENIEPERDKSIFRDACDCLIT